MKYYIITYGCQMNKSDSERIASILEKIKYQPAQKIEEADLIIVNACSVRQSAIDRIYGQNKYFNKLKNRNAKLKIILTGCLLNKDKEEMSKIFDFIIDIKEIAKLPQLIGRKVKLDKNLLENYFHIEPKYSSKIEAYVPIMTGCNNYCAYCVVPYTRGPEISRPAQEIIKEIKNLIKNGYKKITLLGQNVNSYKSEIQNRNKAKFYKFTKVKKVDFTELIKMINALYGKFWFSFITNHPKDMSERLIKTLPHLDKFCHYLHLPVQSGSNTILKRMNRHYTITSYKKIIKRLRQLLPDLNLSTDIIVGFPGENEKQFLATKKLMEEIKFDMAYIACYSPRPQTTAFKLNDNIPYEEKQRRKKILNKILAKTALENNKKYLAKEMEVLVTNKDPKKKNVFYGETKNCKKVAISSRKNLIGKFIKVKIISAETWGLKGEIL